MNTLNPTAWQNNLTSSAEILWSKLAEYFPNVIGTILLLLVGYLVSKLIARVTQKTLQTIGIDKISTKVGLHEGLKKIGVQLRPSDLFAKILFWLIMLVFIISASEALNLTKITSTIDAFVRYLPNILGAGLIFILGLMFAHFVKNIIENYAQKIHLNYGKTLAVAIHSVVVVVITVFAIDQLQIETDLLNRIIEITLISTGVTLALSLGFGTKELSRNIISGFYLRDQLKSGVYVELKDIKGHVTKVGAVNSSIEGENKEIYYVPNSSFTENIVKSKKA